MQDISLAVKVDKRQVKDLSKLVGQVEKQVGALNKIKVNLDVTKASKSLKELAADADKAAASLINAATGATKGGEQFSNSLAKLAEQQARLRSAFLKTNDPIKQQQFGLGLLVGQYKQLRVEGRALATAGADIFGKTLTDRSGVGDLSKRLKELKELPKTFSGTGQALKEINFLLNNAVADSEEFKMLIKAQNEALLEQKNIQNALNIEAKFGERMAAIPKAVATTQYAPGAVGPQPFVPKALLPPSAVKTTKDVATNLKSSVSDIDEILNLANKLSRPMRTIALQADRAAKSQERFKRKLKESLQLGVGFPLLFGGGPGSIAGGAIGALSGGGFGGQVFGSAIGQQIEQLINGISEIGTAIETIDVERLRSAGVRITAELKNQVDLLRESGDLVKARAALEEGVFQQTGALPGVTQDIANAVNLLAAAGKELGLAVGTTLGILGAPVIALLASITKVLADIIKSINTVFSLIGVGLKTIGTSILKLANVDVKKLEESLKNVNGQLDSIQDRQFENIRASTQQLTSMLEETSLIKRLKIEEDYTTKVENLRLKLGKKLIEISRKQRIDYNLDPSSSDQTLKNARMIEENLEIAKVQRQINILRAEDLETAKSTATQAQDLAKEFSREVRLRQAGSDVARDLLQIQFEHEDRVKKINKLENQSLRTEQLTSAELLNQLQIRERLATFATTRTKGEVARDNLNREIALLQHKLAGKEEEFLLEEELTKLREALKDIGLDEVDVYEDLLRQIRERKKLEKALNENLRIQKAKTAELQSVYKQIGQTIETGVVEAISAAVDKTKTLGEVAANVLRQIANQLLRLGVNQLMGAIFNPYQSLMVPGGRYEGAPQLPELTPPPPLPGKALGGAVGAGRPYMVGERGPELFVPGAQGNIVPNNAMGGANVTVNVDASGSSVEGSADQASQLGKAIGIAVQQELVKQKRPGGLLAR